MKSYAKEEKLMVIVEIVVEGAQFEAKSSRLPVSNPNENWKALSETWKFAMIFAPRAQFSVFILIIDCNYVLV